MEPSFEVLFNAFQFLLLAANWADFIRHICFVFASRQNEYDEDWSFVNPRKIPKPFINWTIQECQGTLSDLVLPIASSEMFIRFFRWVFTIAITFVWVARRIYAVIHSYLLPVARLSAKQSRFHQVARAFEQLTKEQDSAEHWVSRTNVTSTGLRALWMCERWVNAIWIVVSFALLFQIRRNVQKHRAPDKSKHTSSSVTEWILKSDWKTRVFCLLWIALTVTRVLLMWRVEQVEQNPFVVMGIAPTTDLKTIKKAFRQLSLQYHSD